MDFKELEQEIDYIMRLKKEELEETSEKDLLKYIKKLERNQQKIDTLKKHKKNANVDLNAGNRIITIDEKIDDINEVLEHLNEEVESKKSVSEKKEKHYTLNQKFEILKKTGFVFLIIEKFDTKLQIEIFSKILGCSIDTARKIHSGTYKKTNDVNPLEFKNLLKKIETP